MSTQERITWSDVIVARALTLGSGETRELSPYLSAILDTMVEHDQAAVERLSRRVEANGAALLTRGRGQPWRLEQREER
jgi:hypothetical protein